MLAFPIFYKLDKCFKSSFLLFLPQIIIPVAIAAPTKVSAYIYCSPSCIVCVFYRLQSFLSAFAVPNESSPSQIHIHVNYEQNYFELTITDNGIGFNTEKISSHGLGLKNIQNRIKFIQARLSINSSYGGTEIKISIPKK